MKKKILHMIKHYFGYINNLEHEKIAEEISIISIHHYSSILKKEISKVHDEYVIGINNCSEKNKYAAEVYNKALDDISIAFNKALDSQR